MVTENLLCTWDCGEIKVGVVGNAAYSQVEAIGE